MSKHQYTWLTVEQMEKLPTHRLLAYKKKLQTYGPHFGYAGGDNCNCNQCLAAKKSDELIESAKKILNTREHVKR